MSAIYDSETRKHQWWAPMPDDFWAKVNGSDWKRKYAYPISDSDSYKVHLYWKEDNVYAKAEIKFSGTTKICLFIGQVIEDHEQFRKGDFVIASGTTPDWDNASNLTLLWRPAPCWMDKIDGFKKLSEINIPGTHNSGVRYVPSVECQSLKIRHQLCAGIRYLDIGCRHFDNKFLIHNGPFFQHINFGEGVIDVCLEYLRKYKSETIIMNIKEEYMAMDNTRSFEDTLKSYMKGNESFWYTDFMIPRLEDVRGKIVLIRRFMGSSNMGIPAYEGWNYQGGTFTLNDIAPSDVSINKIRVQDAYKVWYTKQSFDEKWNNIKKLFNGAIDGSKNVWYLNFISGSAHTRPEDVAKGGFLNYKGMNERLAEYLKELPKDRYGTILMDFPEWKGNELIPLIIDKN
ncbi:MAG: phosphatidylinositol-specific phospholipase C [Cytophagales bacterium]|nr:phosphatidylinositol-specific phospholipase C [Cytophagales bacterium]